DGSTLGSASGMASTLRAVPVSVERDHAEASSPSTSIPAGPPALWTAAAAGAAVAAVALAAGGETMKLLPHFLHLMRAPIRVGGILPRSPQVGHVTNGIVPTSLPPGRAGGAGLFATSSRSSPKRMLGIGIAATVR